MKRIVIGEAVVDWVARRVSDCGSFPKAVGIGLEDARGLIAGVAYCGYNKRNLFAHIASDGSKRWLNRRFLWTIFDYPFNQAKIERLTVTIDQGNRDSLNFVEHLGFQYECFLKDAHPAGNILIYFMRKPHAERWLALNKATHEDQHKNRLAVAA